MKPRFSEKSVEFESWILAATHFVFKTVISVTMFSVYRLFGIRASRVTLRHAEIYLLATTALLGGLIFVGEFGGLNEVLGWIIIFLGNIRILQILSLNLDTLIFDIALIRETKAVLKRARWHFVAIGFSVLDTVLVFGFMYRFFDAKYGILNQHFPGFFEYFYYSTVTFSTIGYGDIHPVSTLGRWLVMYEVIVALCFLVFFVSGALGRLYRHQVEG